MKPVAIMWVGENCPKCEEIKGVLVSKGYEIDSRPVANLTNGEEFNPKALKSLAAQNYATPLVCIDEMFFDQNHSF